VVSAPGRAIGATAVGAPPLRTDADVAAVRAGLADGTLDVIATDHAPHHYDEKESAFDDAPFGIVGLEALTLGTPVAAWGSGGVQEWHPGGGLLASWGDIEGLARALRLAPGHPVDPPGVRGRHLLTGRLEAVYEASVTTRNQWRLNAAAHLDLPASPAIPREARRTGRAAESSPGTRRCSKNKRHRRAKGV